MTDDVLCCICKGRHDYIVNGQEHSKFNFLSEPLNHPNEFLLCAHCDNGGHSSCLYGDIRRGYFDTYLCREHAKLHVVKSVGDSVTHVYYKDDLVWVISEIDSAICWVKAQIIDFTRPSGGDVCAYVRKIGGHMCALGDRNQVLIVKFCELRPRDSEGCAPSYDMVNRQFQDLSVLVASRSEDSVQCIQSRHAKVSQSRAFSISFRHVRAKIGPMASQVALHVFQLLAGPWGLFQGGW